ncbi:ATP-binding protein [Roseateles sp. BYS87W]|uniref:ATP-binding protein n=1 Tax=Pelomonas baiyunensis TaxID=3299026 RepID=A0ABW7GZL7_9BURK
MSGTTPQLSGAALARAFPFFLQLNRDGTVREAGPGLQRVMPGLVPGMLLSQHLTPSRPRALASTADWARFDGQALLLENREPGGLGFRGQISVQDDTAVLLLLRPKLQSFEDMQARGLQLTDFAAHDATGDMLMLQQAATASREDAQRLTDCLREKSDHLQLMSELSLIGMGYFSSTGELKQSNLRLRALLNLSADAPALKTVDDVERRLQALAAEADAAGLNLGALARHAEHGGEATELRTRDGRHLSIAFRAGTQQEHVIFIRDITQETLVDRMKSEFLTTAAHELRTPMTSIYGFSELLMRPNLPPDKLRSAVDTIHRQAAWMVKLLNEVLDMARIEARQSDDLRLDTLALADLLASAVDAYGSSPQRERLQLQVQAALPPLLADPVKAGQALGNVISNALKYSPDGESIEIRCMAEDRDGLAGVRIEVQDRGIGMSEEQVARIFERFYRADPSGHVLGTGLGMSLVEQIMKLHRGSVDVRSTPGLGTCVGLWFPAQP